MNKLIAKIKRRVLGDSYFAEARHVTNEAKPIYYIIRRVPLGEGFFSNYFYVLSHVVYACKNGWCPVVDMKNYQTLYTDEGDHDNIWEKYFKPMGNVSLEQAYESENYILSSGKYLKESGVPVYDINQGHITKQMVGNLQTYINQYMCVSHDIIEEIEKFKTEHDWISYKYIGVHIRGTDMHTSREGHTLPPRVDQIVNQIDKIMSSNKEYRVFLCTDEQNVVEHIKAIYGDKVLYCEEYRTSENDGVGLHKEKSKHIRVAHKYLLGKEILIDAILLSECERLVCGISNVTSAAVLFNNGKYSEVKLMK